MKKEFMMIMIACIGFIISSSASAACYYQSSCARPACVKPQDPYFVEKSCQCADPACEIKNDCYSRSVCCRAFGNIGVIDE